MKKISLSDWDTWTDGTFKTSAIRKYQEALKGLSVEQSVFTLSTRGLTEEQIRQVLVTDEAIAKDVEAALAKAGLTNATKALTQAELVETATKNGMATATAKELLSKIGIVEAETGQVAVKYQLTKATIEKAVANDILTASEGSQLAAVLGLNVAETTSIGITDLLTGAITRLNTAIKANPILAVVGASVAAIYFAYKIVKKKTDKAKQEIINVHNEAQQALNDTKSEIQLSKSELESINSELENTKQKIQDIASQDNITLIDQNELDRLSAINTKLETQEKILENNIKLKEKAAALDAKDLLETEVEMDYSDLQDNHEIVTRSQSSTYKDHAEYQASNLRNAYNIYMQALKERDEKKQEIAQELIDSSSGNVAELTSSLMEIIKNFQKDDGTIIAGYEDIYNQYMKTIYNLQALTDPSIFVDIAKSATVGTNIDYEKAISDGYALAYKGEFDIDKINQDFVKALVNFGVDESTIKYIFNLKQEEYDQIIDKIDSRFPHGESSGKKIQQSLNVDGGMVENFVDLTDSEKEIIKSLNLTHDTILKYAENNPIEFELITSYDEGFEKLGEYIEEEKKSIKTIPNELKEQYQRYQDINSECNDYINNLDNIYKKYGNINNVDRQIIYWDDNNMEKWSKQITDWGWNDDGNLKGSWSTVLGDTDNIHDLEFAYTALLNTEHGVVPLTQDEFWKYIDEITTIADDNGGINADNLLKFDAKGLDMEINGQMEHVSNMIAAVEGQIVDGVKLTKNDVLAIAGATSDEIGYDLNSKFEGNSMHVIQANAEESKYLFAQLEEETSKYGLTVKEVAEVVDDSTNYIINAIKRLLSEAKGINKASADIIIPDNISTTVDKINKQLKPAFSNLKSAYQDIFTVDKNDVESFSLEHVSIDTLDNIKSAVDDFNELEGVTKISEKQVNDFLTVLSDSSSTANDVHRSFNELATTLVQNSNYMNADSASQKALIQTLKEMGVTTDKLEDQYTKVSYAESELKYAGYKLKEITYEQLNEFANLATTTDVARDSLISFIQAKADDIRLNTEEDVENLKMLCISLGIASEALVKYEETKAYIERMQEHGIGGVSDEAWEKAAKDNLERFKVELGNEWKEKYNSLFDISNIKYDGNKPDSDKDKKSSKSETKQYFDWIQRKIEIAKDTADKAIKSISDTLSYALTNSRVKKAFKELNNEFQVNAKAYATYMKKANEIGLDSERIRKIQNGEYDIDLETDSDIIEKVQRYQELYNNAKSAKEANDELRDSINSVSESLAKVPTNRASETVSKLDSRIGILSDKLELAFSVNSKEYLTKQISKKRNAKFKAYNSAVSQNRTTLNAVKKDINDRKDKATIVKTVQSYINSNKEIPADVLDKVYDYCGQINDTTLYESCSLFNASLQSLADAKVTAQAYAITLANEKKADRDSLRDAKISQIEKATSSATGSYNYSYSSINSGLKANNKQLKNSNDVYAQATKNAYNELNRKSKNTDANSTYKSIEKASKQASGEYKKALQNAKNSINAKKKISDNDIKVIAKNNSTIANRCALYNADYDVWVNAKYEEALNYATNSASIYQNKQSIFENKIANEDKQNELLDAKISTATSAKNKNNLISKQIANNNEKLSYYISEANTAKANFKAQTTKVVNASSSAKGKDTSKWKTYSKYVNSAVSYVKASKEIPETTIEKLAEGVANNAVSNTFYKACVDYNDSLQYKLQAEYSRDINEETIKVANSDLVANQITNTRDEKLEKVNDRKRSLDGIQSLIDDEMLFDKKNNITKYFSLELGATLSQVTNAQNQLKIYGDTISEIEEKKKKGLLTDEKYNEMLNEAQDGYIDSATALKQYKDQLIDLYAKVQNNELDKINKVIDAREKSLKAKKAYYDYDKSIKAKNKNIQALQNEIAALEGVAGAENAAAKARLEAQLADAKDELDETVEEHVYNLQVDGLDELKENLAKIYEDNLKSIKTSLANQEQLIEDQTKLVKASGTIVESALKAISKYTGVDLDLSGLSRALNGAATGGIISKQGYREDGLMALKAGETVLTDKFTELLPLSVDTMAMFNDNIKHLTDVPIVKPNTSIQPINVTLNYDKLIEVQGSVDATVVSDVKKLTNDIVNKTITTISKDMRRSGVQFKI